MEQRKMPSDGHVVKVYDDFSVISLCNEAEGGDDISEFIKLYEPSLTKANFKERWFLVKRLTKEFDPHGVFVFSCESRLRLL